MAITSVTHIISFAAGDQGFIISGDQAASGSWDSAEGAMKLGAGSYASGNFLHKPGWAWTDFGVPAGKYVLYVDFRLKVKWDGTIGRRLFIKGFRYQQRSSR